MPTYSARCAKCGTEHDYISRIANRDETPLCCEAKTERFITPTMIPAMGLSDHYQVVSPIDGKPIYGRSEYYAHLKKHNVLPESEMKGESEHRKKESAKKDKAARRENILKAIKQHGG
ncbi:hypothetical protein LE191_04180 [Janthinobacterium sp. HSC-3S05]|nr:hypothetical protein [Janthinobacterium lividum]